MRLIAPLKIETKLELLTKLSENLREDYRTGSVDKENLLEELHGSWSDTKDSLSEEILTARTISDREINLE